MKTTTKATKTVSKKAVPKKVVTKKIATAKSTSIKVTGVGVKKVATKKVATKKVSSRAKKPLVVATNYNSFWMNDGQILNTLVALAEALRGMDSAVYKYHTADGRHDFANWVEDVLFDIECADALRAAKTPKSAHTVVVKHIANYQL